MKIKRPVGTSRRPKEPRQARTRSWDPAEHLDSGEAVEAYLDAAFEDGDPSLIAAAVGDVARAAGMTMIANRAGTGRESLYKALSRTGNPLFSTSVRVLAAVGYRLRVAPLRP